MLKAIKRLPFNGLAITAGTSIILNAIASQSIDKIALLSAITLVASIPAVVPKYKKPTKMVLGYLVTTGVLLFDTLSQPANAQFMVQAEEWMTSTFQEAGVIIPLIFNLLRGLLIIYIGFSLFQIINAGRQDEDWKAMAKIPLMILIAITIADQITGMIIG